MKKENVSTEVKIEEPKTVSELIIDITSFNEGEDVNTLVEAQRSIFASENKASQKRSTISISVIMVLSVVAMIFLYTNYEVVSYICMGLAVVVLVVFALLNKRIKALDPKLYIREITTALDRDVFGSNKDFKEVKYYAERKLNLENSNAEVAYANLNSCGSRNYVEALYKDKKINAIECVLFSGQGKARREHFVGRRVEMENSISKDSFVLLSKTDPVNDELTAISTYKEKELAKNYILYSPKGADEKVLPKAFLDAIKTIKIENHLLNLAVIIVPGKTVAFMSYDDASFELPLNKPFKQEYLDQYKKDLVKFLDASILLAGK